MVTNSEVRIPMINGDEFDALTRAKKYYHFKPGTRKEIKRGYRARKRRIDRIDTLNLLSNYLSDHSETWSDNSSLT